MSPYAMRGYRVTGVQKRRYREEGMPLLVLAYGLLQAGIAAFLDPTGAQATSVAHVAPGNIDLIWHVGYIAAGVLIALGVLWPRPVVEALGLWLAAWAMGFNLIALLIVRGVAGTGASLGAFLLAIAVVVWRIRLLHRRARAGRRRVELPHPGPERRT